MDQTLKMRQFWSIIRERLVFILSFGLILGGVSWILAVYFVTPTYEVSRKIVVNNTNKEIDYNTIMTNFQYANTYSDIIYSDVVLENVIRDLKLNTTIEDLAKQIDVTSKNESQVITITVKDTNYDMAIDIVNKTVTVFQNQVTAIMEINNIKLFPPAMAKPNPESINPEPILLTIVGFLTGVIIALSISFILKAFSNTVTSEREIEELLNIPVIGAVSKVQSKDLKLELTENKEELIFSRQKSLGRGAD